MSSKDILIEVIDLKKCYEIYGSPRDRLKQLVLPSIFGLFSRTARLFFPNMPVNSSKYYKEFWALDGISFQIRRGETFGIIGKNGSGKSTLLQILAGTLSPTSGELKVNGRVAALLELGSGFNPEFTGKENVFLNARILGLTQQEILDRYDQIVEFADIGDFIDQPVKTYSSGMFVRLAFAVQAHIDASIVIIDEALAVGDIYFRQKCYARLNDLRSRGVAILLVTHSMQEVEQFCKNALHIEQGKQLFLGTSTEAVKHYYYFEQSKGDMNKVEVNKVEHKKMILSMPCVSAGIKQISSGEVTCIGFGIYDSAGILRNSFKQSEAAHIKYAFRIINSQRNLICGVSITNDKAIIVNGKSSWQKGVVFETEAKHEDILICEHIVELKLACGEYTIEVGLSSLDTEVIDDLADEEFNVARKRLCTIPNIGLLTIAPALKNNKNTITHHGIADLPILINMSLAKSNE